MAGPSGQKVSNPLARAHWPSRRLQVAGRDVVGGGVAEDVGAGVLGGDVAGDRADHHAEFGLVMHLLGLGGQHDRGSGPDHRRWPASGRSPARRAPPHAARRRDRRSCARRRPPWWGRPGPAGGPRRRGPPSRSAPTRRTGCPGGPGSLRVRRPRRRSRRRGVRIRTIFTAWPPRRDGHAGWRRPGRQARRGVGDPMQMVDTGVEIEQADGDIDIACHRRPSDRRRPGCHHGRHRRLDIPPVVLPARQVAPAHDREGIAGVRSRGPESAAPRHRIGPGEVSGSVGRPAPRSGGMGGGARRSSTPSGMLGC